MVTALWLLSALSLLVAGQVAATRADLQGLRMYRLFTEHGALADGAIRMVALALLNAPPPQRIPKWHLTLDQSVLKLEATPASGFIDLNNAPIELLYDMLVFAGKLSPDVAHARAEAISIWRDPEGARLGGTSLKAPAPAPVRTGGRRSNGFTAIEDLMQVPGIDLALYERLSGLVTVHNPLDGVDPRFAPPGVLETLTRGDSARAHRILLARGDAEPTLDIADLPHAWLAHSGMQVYRISASREVDGMTLVRTRWVALERAVDGTPWREVGVEPVRRLTADATRPAALSSAIR